MSIAKPRSEYETTEQKLTDEILKLKKQIEKLEAENADLRKAMK